MVKEQLNSIPLVRLAVENINYTGSQGFYVKHEGLKYWQLGKVPLGSDVLRAIQEIQEKGEWTVLSSNTMVKCFYSVTDCSNGTVAIFYRKRYGSHKKDNSAFVKLINKYSQAQKV